jgi:hypothetical protein
MPLMYRYRDLSNLSQAAAHPRRGTFIPVMEFPARNCDMLHNKSRKCKGENFFILLFLLQEMMHLW